MRSLPKLLISLFLMLLVVGCSTARFAYDNADTFIRWRMLQFLDVHDAQADELDERIDAFLRWHRKTELPKYARDADDAAKRISRGLAREDLVWAYDASVAHAREAARMAAEQTAPLLDRLTPEQVRHMETRFGEENRKFARENLRGSERDRRERRAQRIIERLEDWLGNLSKAQIVRVRWYSERAPLIDEMRDRDNKRLQGEVLAIIRARDSRKRLAERVSNWERGRDPAYAAARKQVRDEFDALLVDIDRSATREQRERALAQLRQYADDFRSLAAKAPGR